MEWNHLAALLNRTGRVAAASFAATLMLGVAVPGKVAAQPAPKPQTKPNIIVILADDLGYADTSLYQGGRFLTPNIKSIADDGALFTAAYATAAVCAPSRAGLLTGRYQERFGYEYNNGPAKRDVTRGLGVSTSEIMISQLLKDDGYHTGAMGKWHLGAQPQFYPMNRGFDEFVGFLPGQSSYIDPSAPGVHASFGPNIGDEVIKPLQPGDMKKWIAQARAMMSAPDHVNQGEDGVRTTMDPTKLTDDQIAQRIMRLRHSFDRGPLNQIVEGADHHVVNTGNEYLTDYWGDRAVNFIQRNTAADKPYFLYLAFNAPHAPHMVTEKYYARFANIKDHQLRVYRAMIAALDDNIGRVLKAVDASGQAGNTLIVFAADNGCAMYVEGLCSCTPLRGGKLTEFEGGIRVPFAIRWPGHIKPGAVYNEPVSTLDVVPTAVAAASGKLPTGRPYDGVNLLPYLNGEKSGEPHNILFWRREPKFAVRDGNWKLWESVDDTGVYGNYKLLFNLKSDLNETTNLAGSHPDKVKELESLIHGWSDMMMKPLYPTKHPVTYNVCGKTFTVPV